jgi:hypothetical protein
MFTPSRWCAEPISQPAHLKVKATLWCLKFSTTYFVFTEPLVKCIPHKDHVQNHSGSRSRSQVAVRGLNHVLCVPFITYKLQEGILWHLDQMWTLLRWYDMFEMRWFKAKVTSGDQSLSQVFPVHSITFKFLEGISWNFGQMFTSLRCAEHVSTVLAQG